MRVFEIEAYGPFSRDRIRVHWTEEEPAPCAELENLAHQTWEAHREEMQRVGGVLFNGPLVRLLSAEVRDGTLVMWTCPTDYVRFLGTNFLNHHLAEAFGWEAYSNPVGTSAVVVTSDHHLVLGRRSLQVASHAGMIHTFGGAIEPEDRDAEGRIDPYGAIARELVEELALDNPDLNALLCLGLTRDATIRQPELIFRFDLPESLSRLQQRFAGRGTTHGEEHTDLVALPDRPEAISHFIEQERHITPIAVSSLWLYGRIAHGQR